MVGDGQAAHGDGVLAVPAAVLLTAMTGQILLVWFKLLA